MASVVCYARVSTLEQNPQNQYEDLERRAKEFGEFEVLTESESTRKERPVKFEVMRRIKSGECKVLLVWKLDRLARSLAELMFNLEDFKQYKVRFISIRDNIDLIPDSISPIQELYFGMLGSFAQFERDLIRERSTAGRLRAVKEGKHMGRPAGSKDRKVRRKSGYWLRWSKYNESLNNSKVNKSAK